MKSKLLQILTDYHIKTGGHSGLIEARLEKLSGYKWSEMKDVLNELWTEGKIEVRDGIQGKLIRLKHGDRS